MSLGQPAGLGASVLAGSRRVRYVLGAEALALLIVAIAALLGAQEFVGTFGSTGQAKSCGSVWRLPNTGDLNAASCQGELRGRLTLVAGLIGLAACVALIAPLMLRRRSSATSRGRILGVLLALGIPILISMAMIAIGRHLMCSVSGG